MDKLNNLKNELVGQIERFEKESKKHKKLYRSLRYSALMLTGLATIFAASAFKFPVFQEWLNIAVVFVTTSAGIITSIEGLRKPAELWIHERNLLYSLKDLKRELDYFGEEIKTKGSIDSYFEKLQEILSISQEKWTKKVIPQNNSSKNG